jgi:L-rhamnose mutarotase
MGAIPSQWLGISRRPPPPDAGFQKAGKNRSSRGHYHMPRSAFRLRIKPDSMAAYDEAHRHVWPELLATLKQVGISDYSVFRRGQDLFLVMRVEDFDAAWDELAKDPVNLRWQAEMSKLFEPVLGLQPGERFAMMQEVFYLE